MRFCIAYLFFLLLPAVHAEKLEVGKMSRFKTIHEAIQSAATGDTILVHGGTYKEGNIAIEKPLTLVGEDYPVIDGEDKYELITIKSNEVNVSGFVLKNSGKSSMVDLAAIKLQKVAAVNIFNNQLLSNYFGIYLAGCQLCTISSNTLQGTAATQQSSGNGIHLWKCKQIKIEKNLSQGHRDGIYFEFVTQSEILNNKSQNNLRYGLHFMFSDNDSYESNVFSNNGAGVAVMYTKNVKMHHNTFSMNWGSGAYGLLLKDIRDSEIRNNTFAGNTTGIYAESASRIKISENNFAGNGWALRITSSCDELNIIRNNFLNNTFDMASGTSNASTANSYDGNYWDKYDGYDLNRDKFGDVPYYPVCLSAILVEKIPVSGYFLHSFVLDLINQSEKVVPSLIPEGIRDNRPSMKKYSI